MFPVIKNLADLLPFIEGNSMIRVKPCEVTGLTVVCYMVQDEDMFAGVDAAWEKECRGITFYSDGSVAARTLHKFQNIGETEALQPQNLRWAEVTRIMAKRDGSMVTPVLLPSGSIKFKTKKSFDTKEASLADEVLKNTEGGEAWVRALLNVGYTPTFEITSPKFPIVLLYEKDELTVLHIRFNETGRYASEEELLALNSPFPIVQNELARFIGEGVPANLVSWEKLKEYAETAEGVEGVVIQFGQDMCKLKTRWYIDLHRSIVFLRERDIAEAVLDDRLDDLLGAFAMAGKNQQPLRDIAVKVRAKLKAIDDSIQELLLRGFEKNLLTRKELAMEFRDHPHFGMLMKIHDMREPNVSEWYKKHHLKEDFSLEVIADS